MRPLYKEPKGLIPGIHMDKESNKFQIFGTSCPSDPFEVFNPVTEWFDEYIKDPLQETILDLNLNYYNTASSKFLLRIMYKLEDLVEKGNDVKVKWFYSEEDEDMREEGEEYDNLLNLNFEIISLDDEENVSDDDSYFESILDEEF